MFENVADKLMQAASLWCWLGIISSIIAGLMFMENTTVIGLAIMLLGSFISWLSSLVLYGFGELLEKVNKIASKT